MTLSNYVNRDMVGTFPLKKGAKPKVPPELLDLLNFHVSMTQLTGVEEAKARTLKTMIGAAIRNTSVEGKARESYIYRKFQENYPHTSTLLKALEMEERQKALNHRKFQHILGDGGASDETKLKLESKNQSYAALKIRARDAGINEFVFDA